MRTAHRLNVVGDFYVEAGCCTLCGLPKYEAPELFEEADDGCYVKKQPTTPDELGKMVETMQTQDLTCVRYRGHDRTTLATLSAAGQGSSCDALSKPR
jgi:hypothetical protein